MLLLPYFRALDPASCSVVRSAVPVVGFLQTGKNRMAVAPLV
jgi:hypothetical protein